MARGSGNSPRRTGRRKSARRLSIQYAVDLSLAYIIAVIDASAILIPLRGHTSVGADADFAQKNTATVVVLVALGIAAVAVAGVVSIRPTVRWFAPGHEPDAEQREAVVKLAGRQTVILLSAWGVAGAILMVLNRTGGAALLLPILLGVLLGGPAAAPAMLLPQRTLRPIMGAAPRGREPRLAVPGVLARLVLLWFLCSALPIGVVAALVVLRGHGWLI